MNATTPLPPQAAALDASARRLATPCGSGEMVWRVWGRGAPLVLLHGGSGSWTHWLRNIEALVDSGRSVYAADLPGFGESASPPSGGDADALVEPLLQGLHQMFGPVAVPVVAFSFGSLVATLAARQQPGAISQLVLVGAPVLALEVQPFALRPWLHLQDPVARRSAHRHNLGALMLARPESIDELALDIHAHNLERDRLRNRRMVRTDAMARALEQLRCPVDAIYGEHDVLYRDRWPAVQALLESLPTFRRLQMLADTGHWAQFESPDRFMPALAGVL